MVCERPIHLIAIRDTSYSRFLRSYFSVHGRSSRIYWTGSEVRVRCEDRADAGRLYVGEGRTICDVSLLQGHADVKTIER